MKLRNLSFFLLSVLLFIYILNFYFNFFRLPLFGVTLFEAVPAQSALIVRCSGVEQLDESSDNTSLWTSFQKTPFLNKIKTDLSTIQTRLSSKGDSTSVFKNNEFIAALQKSNAQESDFLYVFEQKGIAIKPENFEILENVTINESVYLKERVYELVFNEDEQIAVCFYQNIILFARFPFMVEDALAQLVNPQHSILDEIEAGSTKKSSGQPEISVYFNFKNFPKLFNRTSHKEILSVLEDYNAIAAIYFYKNNEIEVEGNLIGVESFQSNSKFIKVNESILFDVIPDNCSFINWRSKNYKNEQKELEDKDSVFNNYVSPWIGEESAIFALESRKNKISKELFSVFKMENVERAKESLEAFGLARGKLQDVDYQSFKISQLLSDDLIDFVQLMENRSSNNPYYVLLNDYVIFSNSRQSLEGLIDKFILSQTLSNSAEFLQFKSTLNPKTNAFFYANTSLFIPFLRQLVGEEDAIESEAYFDFLSTFDVVGIQSKQKSNSHQLNFYLNSDATTTNPTKIIWKANLKAEASIPPTVIRNAKKNRNEIFIQDKENRIYLFDRNGELLWERMLGSEILSKIHPIEYYESGESQLVFNTKNQIYLMGHDGKDIGVYPMKLPAAASNGLCVIDFENDHEYQFFVGAQNGNIYGFEKTGKPIDGWNPRENIGKLSHDIEHFQVTGSDYILALTESGTFHVLSRNGERKFESSAFETAFLSPPDYQAFPKKARIVLTDQFGKAKVFNSKGKHFNLYVGTGRDKFVQFLFSDVIGDDRKDYITLSGSDLSCYFYNKSKFSKAFVKQFEHPQDELFEVERAFKKSPKIGTLSKAKRSINLLDNKGNVVKGFPLAGSTEFLIWDLFDTKKEVLVVALDDIIYTCKIE